MATTVEQLEIIINAKVDAQVNQIGTMLAAQFKAAEAAMQPLQSKVQALSTAMSNIGKSVGEPMQKSFRQIQSEINKAQAKANAYSASVMKKMNSEAESQEAEFKKRLESIPEVFQKMQSAIDKAQSKTDNYSAKAIQQMNAQMAKEESIQEKRAEAQQKVADKIIQQYREIEAAAIRATATMQKQSTPSSSLPSASVLPTGYSKDYGLTTSVKQLQESIAQAGEKAQQSVKKIKESFDYLDGSTTASLDNLNNKIELQKEKLGRLSSEYQIVVEKFGAGSSEALNLQEKMVNLSGTINGMIAKSDKLAQSIDTVAKAEKKAAEEAKSAFSSTSDKSVANNGQNFSEVTKSVKKAKEETDKATAATKKYGNSVEVTARKAGADFLTTAGKIKQVASLVINIIAKIGNTIKDVVSGAIKLFAKLGSSIKSAFTGAINTFSKFIKSVKSTTEKASGMFGGLGETIKRVLIMGTLYKGFRQLFSFVSNGIKDAIAAPEIENLFRVAMGNMANEAAKFATQLKKSLGVDEYTTKEMLGTFQNMSTSMGIGANTAYTMSKSLTILANDMASLYNVPVEQSFQNLQSALTGQGEAVKKYGFVINETTIKEAAWRNGLVATGQELTSAQKPIAAYMALLEQSKNAQGDMARTMGSLQNQLRVLKGNVAAAGRAIGEAFLPFLQAIVPWLNALAIVLQRAGNALARFTYGLFGMDYDAEKKKQEQVIGGIGDISSGLGDIADAEKDAGDAAEEAGKKIEGMLAPYDKLNIIKSNAQENVKPPEIDTGATGPIEIPGLPSLELPDIESPFEKMADQIINFFKTHSFAEIGKILAEKLNEIIASIDWYALGAKLGYWFQQILEFAYQFLVNFDWIKFGSSIASAIMGFIDAIDWNLFGATIAEYFNSIFEFVYGFITRLEWNKIGLYISNAIMGFFNSIDLKLMAQTIATLINGIVNMMYEAITKTDWKAIANKIGDAINSFFTDVNWEKLGSTIGAFFQTLITFILEIVTTLDWAAIGTYIATAFEGFFNSIDLNAISSYIAKLWNGIVDLIYNFVINTNWAKIGTEIGDAINTFFTDVDWGKTGKAIEGFVRGIIDFLTKFILTVDWETIGNAFSTALGSVNWTDVMAYVGFVIASAINGMLPFLWEAFKNLFTLLSVPIVLVAQEIGNFLIEGLKQGISNAIAGIASWLKTNIVDPVVNGIKTLLGIHSPSTVFAEIGGFLIQGLINGILNFLPNIMSTISTFCGSVAQWFSGGFKVVTDSIIQVFSGVLAWIKSAWESTWKSVANFFIGIWNGILSGLESALNWIIGGINKVVSFLNKAINGAKNLLAKVGITVSFSVPNVEQVSFGRIPKLASGGVLRRSAIVNVAEYAGAASNPEIVTPQSIMYETMLEANASLAPLIERAMDKAANKIVNAIAQNALEADESGMFKIVQKKNAEYRQMTGSPAF